MRIDPDHYPCHNRYRHITLAQLAAAFLAVQDAEAIRQAGPIASARFGAPKGGMPLPPPSPSNP